jgi:hypothetical protein
VIAGTAANFAFSQFHDLGAHPNCAALNRIPNKVPRHMNNKLHTRNFTRSDDALILEQPVTRIGVKILARMMHTSQERVIHRADELGVSLAISDDQDGAVDTQTLRLGLIDPLLERLKRLHGDRK